ncbi:FAD-dependent oxidoreductase [Streptomyces massasporeus]|uniref:FAD-dependent oxidoreductase n=1 Tax=Streptomyces massasporeus TaxID=67324 RepID=A0ABW6LM26_9ACTN
MGEPTRVAVVGPFSGPRASWGRLLTDAMKSRLDSGISWEPHDDRGDAGTAAKVGDAIVANGGFTAVVGHFNSMGAARVMDRYRDAGLPLLLPLATAPGLLTAPGALRWCAHDTGQVEALIGAARHLGHRAPHIADDGSTYGRRLADRFRDLLPCSGPSGPLDAVVVCGTHAGAAATARRLRAEGFGGRFLFTDDCAVDDFPDLLGAAAGDAHVARLRGGARRHVEAAFNCLVDALMANPGSRGDELLTALRKHAGIGFDARGDAVDAGAPSAWEVVPLTKRSSHSPPPVRGRVPGADVIVVGDGVVGCAIAAELAASGRSVALASLGPDAPAATAQSGGLVRAYEPQPVLRSLAIRSHQRLWGADPELAASCGFRRTGSLVLLGPDDLPKAERGLTQLRAAGIAADLLPAEEVSSRWPDLAVEDIVAALWEPDGGYASPPATAAAFRTRALRSGATSLPYGPVRALLPHRRGAEVVMDGATLTAGCVVVAAGTGSAALLGDRLRFRPGTSAPRTRHIRYAFFDRGGREVPAVNDLTTGVWGRPQVDGEAAGGYLTGRPVEEWDVSPVGGDALTEEQVAYIREGAAHRWPWLAHAPVTGGRFGTDVYHPDGPFIGLLPGEPSTVVAACWSGAGFKTAPGAAAEAAAAVSHLLEARR